MKYCPKDKKHKNPIEAVFCCECGSQLIEVADNKICSKCHTSNPIRATYCAECGAELPDENGYIDFKVISSVVCDRILAVNYNQIKRNTDNAVFKLKANNNIEILFEYKFVFKTTVDTSKVTSLTYFIHRTEQSS